MANDTKTQSPVKAPENGAANADQPELTAAQQLAVMQAKLDQARQAEADLANAVRKLADAEAARQRAAAMASIGQLFTDGLKAVESGDVAEVLRLATEAKAQATQVARDAKVSTRGSASSGSGFTPTASPRGAAWNAVAGVGPKHGTGKDGLTVAEWCELTDIPSSGHIANTLENGVAAGKIVKTGDSPRKYRWLPTDESPASATPDLGPSNK